MSFDGPQQTREEGNNSSVDAEERGLSRGVKIWEGIFLGSLGGIALGVTYVLGSAGYYNLNRVANLPEVPKSTIVLEIENAQRTRNELSNRLITNLPYENESVNNYLSANQGELEEVIGDVDADIAEMKKSKEYDTYQREAASRRDNVLYLKKKTAQHALSGLGLSGVSAILTLISTFGWDNSRRRLSDHRFRKSTA